MKIIDKYLKEDADVFTSYVIPGLISATIGTIGTYRYYRYIAPFEKKCNHFYKEGKLEEYRKCLNTGQINRAVRVVRNLKQLRTECSKQNDPQKCIEKFDKKIEKYEKFIKRKKRKYHRYNFLNKGKYNEKC